MMRVLVDGEAMQVTDVTDVRPWWESPLCAVFYRNTPEGQESIERDALRARELGCTVGIHEGREELSLSFGGALEAREAFGREIEQRWR